MSSPDLAHPYSYDSAFEDWSEPVDIDPQLARGMPCMYLDEVFWAQWSSKGGVPLDQFPQEAALWATGLKGEELKSVLVRYVAVSAATYKAIICENAKTGKFGGTPIKLLTFTMQKENGVHKPTGTRVIESYDIPIVAPEDFEDEVNAEIYAGTA